MSSSAWKFFEKIKGEHMAKCLICKREYSYKTSVTNLIKHLNRKHLSSHKLITIKEKQVPVEISSPVSELVAEASTSHASVVPTFSPVTKSFKIKREKKPISIKKNLSIEQQKIEKRNKKIIDKKLLKMITHDFQPFSIVEDEGFRSFVEALDPNYKLPDPKVISGTWIPNLYLDCKRKMFQLVQEAKSVCLTTECWTSVAMDSYLAVTAHFYIDYQLKTVLLHCEQLHDTTVDTLAVSLQNIASEWQITNKITLIVSDKSANITDAINRTGWPSFGCFLHKLNLVIKKSLKTVEFIIKRVQSIVGHFKRSDTDTEILIQYQIDFEKKSQALKLIQSVPTRWNSVYFMLKRFLELQLALQHTMGNLDVDLPIITDEMWKVIKQVTTILRPFEEVTQLMNGMNYLTGSLGIVIIDGLKNVLKLLQTKPNFGAAKIFLNTLDAEMNNNFPENEIEDNIILGLCTFLDPRFKIHAFIDNSSDITMSPNKNYLRKTRSDFIKNHVLELLETKWRRKRDVFNIITEALTPSTSYSPVEEMESFSIWGKIDRNIAALTPAADDIAVKAKNELELFLNEEVVQRDSCPFSWWKSHSYTYPNLAEIFQEHCHIVISSVECKRFFSKAGCILTQKRALLSRKHTAELVFIKSNESYCE